MHAKRNTPEGNRLDLLVTLVEAWEARRYPPDLQRGEMKQALMP
jgi:HTH-type transcriptional regulator/antitoxin HigA